MFYSGDEVCGDDITSGPDTGSDPLDVACTECGADVGEHCHPNCIAGGGA